MVAGASVACVMPPGTLVWVNVKVALLPSVAVALPMLITETWS